MFFIQHITTAKQRSYWLCSGYLSVREREEDPSIESDFRSWCIEHGVRPQILHDIHGTDYFVKVDDEKTALAFKMRWC